jgi:hypothetical protein
MLDCLSISCLNETEVSPSSTDNQIAMKVREVKQGNQPAGATVCASYASRVSYNFKADFKAEK